MRSTLLLAIGASLAIVAPVMGQNAPALPTGPDGSAPGSPCDFPGGMPGMPGSGIPGSGMPEMPGMPQMPGMPSFPGMPGMPAPGTAPPAGVQQLPPGDVPADPSAGAAPDCADAPKPAVKIPPALFKRIFKVDGTVESVDAGANSISVQDAEMAAAKKFSRVLADGNLIVKVNAKTKIVDDNGDKVALADIEEGDDLRVRGKFQPKVKWVTDEENDTTTPVLTAMRITVDKSGD